MSYACSQECALSYTRDRADAKATQEQRKTEKARKADHKARREALKSVGKWTKEAQTEFNRFIRLRDYALPCISCQRHHDGQYHSGHFRPTSAAPELRFDATNVHKQCAPCNNHLSGNLTEYRINLINEIGLARVEFLEGPHEVKQYRIPDLKEIKAKYKRLADELVKMRDMA